MTPSDLADTLAASGKSQRTVAEYVKWCRRLHRWAHHHGLDVATLTPGDLRRWADETVPKSWASRKQASAMCRHLYRGRQDEPWLSVRVPRKPRPDWRGLEPADAGRVRDAALLAGGRAGLATLVGLYTAARAVEIAGLRWDGVSDDTIRWWRSKTQEFHSVPTHPVLADALTPRGEGFVFVGNNGRDTVTPMTIWKWVVRVGELAGIGGVTPQRLRATAGTMALEATQDLDAAAELLGHRDVAVTRQHYTRTSQRRLSAAVDALDYG